MKWAESISQQINLRFQPRRQFDCIHSSPLFQFPQTIPSLLQRQFQTFLFFSSSIYISPEVRLGKKNEFGRKLGNLKLRYQFQIQEKEFEKKN